MPTTPNPNQQEYKITLSKHNTSTCTLFSACNELITGQETLKTRTYPEPEHNNHHLYDPRTDFTHRLPSTPSAPQGQGNWVD
jgi:hypothetical protein